MAFSQLLVRITDMAPDLLPYLGHQLMPDLVPNMVSYRICIQLWILVESLRPKQNARFDAKRLPKLVRSLETQYFDPKACGRLTQQHHMSGGRGSPKDFKHSQELGASGHKWKASGKHWGIRASGNDSLKYIISS